MDNIKLYKFIQQNIDNKYTLQVFYYLMRRLLLDTNFNNQAVKTITISRKYLPQPISVDICHTSYHELDGLTSLLFLRAVMINNSYLNFCFNDAPLFRKVPKTVYEWVDWLNIINECKNDDDFNQILEFIITLNSSQKLSDSQIEDFRKKTVSPPYNNLSNYYHLMADSNEDCDEVIKSNAHVCDDTLETFIIDENIGFIGNTAFAYCDNLSSITIKPLKVKFGHFPIVECPNLKQICVPKESLDYYKEELPYYSDIICSIGEQKPSTIKKDIPLTIEKIDVEKKPSKDNSIQEEVVVSTKKKEIQPVSINYNLIYEVFKNESTSYNYFWLLSLLSIIKRKGNPNISFHEMAAEMIASAWPVINEYKLDLGKTDSLKSIISKLTKVAPLVEKSSPNIVRQYIVEHYDRVKATISPLLENVPYRFLSPWIKFITTSDVIQKSNDLSIASPYALLEDSIILDEDWYDYFLDNHDKLTKFAMDSLLDYLKKHNSEMVLLKYKLNNKK